MHRDFVTTVHTLLESYETLFKIFKIAISYLFIQYLTIEVKT